MLWKFVCDLWFHEVFTNNNLEADTNSLSDLGTTNTVTIYIYIYIYIYI